MTIEGDIRSILTATVLKKSVPMEISLFFYVLCDRFWSCFETEISENAISPPQMTENKSAVKQHF